MKKDRKLINNYESLMPSMQEFCVKSNKVFKGVRELQGLCVKLGNLGTSSFLG